MRVYTNSLGITCVEPAEGYLLKKNEETYKKVYLGINDRADLYEEVVDESYMNRNKEEENEYINRFTFFFFIYIHITFVHYFFI